MTKLKVTLEKYSGKALSAVIVTGNPKYIKTPEAIKYYNDIEAFLKANGVIVRRDPGNDYTCPPKADFYIGHSRGASRIRCFRNTTQEKDFLMFGDPDGYIHPVDREWQKNNPPSDKFNPPPVEHFEFYEGQQKAILNKIKELGGNIE